MLFSLTALALALPASSSSAADAEFELQTDIVYSEVADLKLHLDAYIPATEGPHPAVLVVHGGAWRFGNRKQLSIYAQNLARQGMSCFAIDYRLAPTHKFPAQIDDCRAAVKWIRQHAEKYKVDPKRVGAIGYSAGGHLVTLLGTTGEAPTASNGFADTRIQAVVAGGAPTDFRWFPDNGHWAEFLMGGDLTQVPEKFKAASSAAFADKSDPPTFFFNGTSDELVPLVWSKSCFEALRDAGVTTEFYEIKGASHLAAAGDPKALDKAFRFLAKHLSESESAEE